MQKLDPTKISGIHNQDHCIWGSILEASQLSKTNHIFPCQPKQRPHQLWEQIGMILITVAKRLKFELRAPGLLGFPIMHHEVA